MLVEKAIQHLQKSFKSTEVIAIAIWTVSDVVERAKKREIELSQEQAEEVLDNIDRHQDCNFGISWDTIDNYIDNQGYRELDDLKV